MALAMTLTDNNLKTCHPERAVPSFGAAKDLSSPLAPPQKVASLFPLLWLNANRQLLRLSALAKC